MSRTLLWAYSLDNTSAERYRLLLAFCFSSLCPSSSSATAPLESVGALEEEDEAPVAWVTRALSACWSAARVGSGSWAGAAASEVNQGKVEAPVHRPMLMPSTKQMSRRPRHHSSQYWAASTQPNQRFSATLGPLE
eukprot:5894544-Lingulodinium_polyedra.AAC.1